MTKSKGGRSCNSKADISGLSLLANIAGQNGLKKKEQKEEDEREKLPVSLFPFLNSGRYQRRLIGWLEAVTRCHFSMPLVKSVFVKQLTKTDAMGHHNRLLIPKELKEMVFRQLNEEEKRIVDEDGKGLLVPTLDEKGRPWALVFYYWSSNRAYIFKRDWSRLADANNFRAGDSVELLAFRQRMSGRLSFVVIRCPPATDHDQHELDDEKETDGDQ